MSEPTVPNSELPSPVLRGPEQEDRRNLRIGYAVAFVLHALLLAVNLPREPVEAAPEEPPRILTVIQPIRFAEPPPEPPEKPPETVVRVPIPDPDPTDPEPIRPFEEIETRIELPTSDWAFEDLPSAPPPPPEPEDKGPIRVSGDVKAPVCNRLPQPVYTEIARKARIQGMVIVEAVISKEGSVEDLKVLRSLPFGLEESAVAAFRQWRCEPARLGETPVSVYYTLTVHFSLQ